MPDPSDPYSGYNAMQAHLGVVPMQQPRSPGDVARMLVDQSSQQRVSAMAVGMPPSWSQGGGSGASIFGEQFRQRFEAIQAQQSYSPYTAQALGGQYAPGMLPSPVMMTPPSTGVFRTRQPGPRVAPLSPQPMMPLTQTPFTPRMPPPMFQLESDRQARMQDQEHDAFFSRAVQAPRVLGQGTGIGIAAMAGGAIGGPLGAIGGGVLGHTSGFAQGVGNLAMRPFQPMIERRQMGASLRRMSQDWVVAGPDLHETGRGFNRDASIRLAEEIQDLAKDRGFKKETGGMFNRGDLMRITQESGRAGLLDESQDIEGVRKNIKNVSRTLRKYMQLTQDPDMVNVLRELGQMKQLGMTLDDMEQAAQDMNRYSRAAGASISGIKQMGMMGASTFQQAGLTAGSGMTYGMHAAAAARQAIATGTFQPRELALMGGMQGMTQRNIQAQAAMLSMPLFGAAVSQYGARGFELNQGALNQMGQGGAQGMVRGAVSAMGQAVQQGGVGALATFPLQQRRLQTEAAEQMTPEQLTAARMRMSLETGQRLGLQGAGAFAGGARVLFGNEVAEQMMYEAQNPQFFQAQRNRINEQQQRLIREQREANERARPGAGTLIGRRLWQNARLGGLGPTGAEVESGLEATGAVLGYQAGRVADVFRGAGQTLRDIQSEAEGRVVTRMDERFVTGAGERRKVYGQDTSAITQAGFQGPVDVGPSYGGRTISQALGYGGAYTAEAAEVGGFLTKTAFPVEGALTQALGFGAVPAAGVEALMGTGAAVALGEEGTNRLVQQQVQRAHRYAQMGKYAAREAGTEEGYTAAMTALGKSAKGKVDSGAAISSAAGKIANMVKSRQNIILPDGTIDPGEVEKALATSLSAEGLSPEEVKKTIKDLKDTGQLEKIGGSILQEAKKVAGPEYATQFDESLEKAQKLEKKAIQDTQNAVMERKEAIVESVEDQLDLTYDIGGVTLGEKAGTEEYREAQLEGPGAMLAKTVAAMTGEEGGDETRKAALAKYTELYGKGRSAKEVRAEFNKLVKKETNKLDSMSSDMKERLRKSVTSGEAGSITESVGAVAQGSAMAIQAKQYGGVISGGLQTVMEAVGGPASGKLLEQLTTGEVTGGGIAGAFSEDDIRSLARSGHKALAGKIARYKQEKDPEKKKQLEQEITENVSQLGEARKKKEEELGEAEGKEAEDLAKSDEALAGIQGEMADAFKDFRPAVDKFSKGAEALERAMESDMFKRMAGED
ncbi:MAG: hypothetical protein DRP83_00960 [Planctomycetota bacterium]|nr:MAG: hypothetical protein DRP83_00960 [Planctomycetota bacterium]